MSQIADSPAPTNEESSVVPEGAVSDEPTNENAAVTDTVNEDDQSEASAHDPATIQTTDASKDNPKDQSENAPDAAAARDAIPSLMSLNVQRPPKSAHRFREARSLRSFWNASKRAFDKRRKRKKPQSLEDVELPEFVRWWPPGGCFQCVVCEIKGYYLSSLNGVKDHCEGRRHRTEAAKFKEELQTEGGGPALKVTSSGQFDRGFQAHILTVDMSQEKARMVFTVTNMTSEASLKFLRWHGPYLNGELRLLKPAPFSPGEDIILEPGESLDLTMEITPKEKTTLRFKVHFRFGDLSREEQREPAVVEGESEEVKKSTYVPLVVENCPVRISIVEEEGERKEPDTEVEEINA